MFVQPSINSGPTGRSATPWPRRCSMPLSWQGTSSGTWLTDSRKPSGPGPAG